jgi:hypothetical protein
MARNRGKKALYEVMSRARSKPVSGKTPEQMAPKRAAEETPATKKKIESPASNGAAKWWKRPRIVQLNAGRIEFSMPYQVAVAVALVLVLMLVASYRVGQFSAIGGQQAPSRPVGQAPQSRQGHLTARQNETPARPAVSDVKQPAAPAESAAPKPQKVEPAKPAGNNVIVVAQYSAMADLRPVQAHFLQNGIELEIVKQGGLYFLQTKQRYDNPNTPGTDGYKARQRIVEIGAKYKGKAPPGYETFAPHYFSDAYGKKVE